MNQYYEMSIVDERLAQYGAFVLRVGLGIMWIAHALLKWFAFTIPGFATWLGIQGLPIAFAWPVFILELVGGLIGDGAFAMKSRSELIPRKS